MPPSRNAATDVSAWRAITNTVTSPNLPIPPSSGYLPSDLASLCGSPCCQVPLHASRKQVFVPNTNLLSTGDGFGGNNVALLEKEWPSRVRHVLICCCGRIHRWRRVGRTRRGYLTGCARFGGYKRTSMGCPMTIGADAIEEIPFRQARGNCSYNQPCFVIIYAWESCAASAAETPALSAPSY
jgi:hypothetical protein